MKSEIEKMTIEKLLNLKKKEILKANPEYQRGLVWTEIQKKKLIDSIFRGYTLPIIYLHYKTSTVDEFSIQALEIIDGQQRLNAIDLFYAGGLTLLDPIQDDKIARFPSFIKSEPCPWGKKSYDNIDSDLKKRFLETEIVVTKITTDNDDEARDLFIRLQAGSALNSQERRDAWPGDFTDFILKIGGKSNNDRYPGHDFFKNTVHKSSVDRGQTRQLCAQIVMLYLERLINDNWIELKSNSIDEYYYKNLSFNSSTPEINKFRKILDKAYTLLLIKGFKKLKGNEAIHLILLVQSLYDDYAPSWEDNFANAFEEFRVDVAYANKNKKGEYWDNYAQWVKTSADSKSSVMTRHNFFTKKMYEYLKPKPLDATRIFGELERQIIFYRDNKRCGVCNGSISWEELEIHHIEEYHIGGVTTLDNGISVHKKCHPKGEEAKLFAQKWKETKKMLGSGGSQGDKTILQ